MEVPTGRGELFVCRGQAEGASGLIYLYLCMIVIRCLRPAVICQGVASLTIIFPLSPAAVVWVVQDCERRPCPRESPEGHWQASVSRAVASGLARISRECGSAAAGGLARLRQHVVSRGNAHFHCDTVHRASALGLHSALMRGDHNKQITYPLSWSWCWCWCL